MADFPFTYMLGRLAEKVDDDDSKLGMLLLTTADTDDTMQATADIAALLATSAVEDADGSYARKTGITGTVTVDTGNKRVDVDVPDQTWPALSGSDTTDLVTYYEEAAADATRIPATNHDFAVSVDGSDVTAQVNAAGIWRAAA